MTKKKKYTRKWMKQPDEFLTTSSMVFYYLYDHWQLFLAGLAGFFLLLAIGWGLFFYKSKKDSQISHEVSQAIALYHQDKLKEGSEQYHRIIDNYGKNKQVSWARLYLAHAYFKQQDYDNAAQWYKDVLSNISQNDILIRAIALGGLAHIFEEQGKLDQAIENYLLISQLQGSFFQVQSYSDLGRCYEHKGDNKNAISYYQKYLEREKDSDLEERISRWEVK